MAQSSLRVPAKISEARLHAAIIDLNDLRDHYDYDAATGHFIYRHPGPNRRVGKIAGSVWRAGEYRAIWFQNKQYKAHRLAWFYTHGEWPRDQIDHVDGDRYNNALTNLRQATNSLNQANRKLNKGTGSGIKGVRFAPRCNRWVARIQHDKKRVEIGYFLTKDEAAAAYAREAHLLFGEYARTA